ncbi:hypothetical protein ACJMK2_043806, partial [Sinanodonta woodiana]
RQRKAVKKVRPHRPEIREMDSCPQCPRQVCQVSVDTDSTQSPQGHQESSNIQQVQVDTYRQCHYYRQHAIMEPLPILSVFKNLEGYAYL